MTNIHISHFIISYSGAGVAGVFAAVVTGVVVGVVVVIGSYSQIA